MRNGCKHMANNPDLDRSFYGFNNYGDLDNDSKINIRVYKGVSIPSKWRLEAVKSLQKELKAI